MDRGPRSRLSVELTWSSVGIDAVVFLLRVGGESSGRRHVVAVDGRAPAHAARGRAFAKEKVRTGRRRGRRGSVGGKKCAFREKGVKSEEGRRLMPSDLRKAGIHR